jgi:hypothetical protein
MAKNEDNHAIDVFSLFVQTERKDSKTFRWPQKVMKSGVIINCKPKRNIIIFIRIVHPIADIMVKI